MIKFFRKIRQKLLTENKFSKYLIYAIGEITLVVIGILIALNINNRNELRKNEQTVIFNLQEIQNDLLTDIARSHEWLIDDYEYQVIHDKIFDFENPWTIEDMINHETTILGFGGFTYLNLNNFIISRNGYESLIRNIDKMSLKYKPVLKDFEILYVSIAEKAAVVNNRMRETEYAQTDFVFNQNWWMYYLEHDEVSQEFYDYYINDDRYKRFAIKYMNDISRVNAVSQQFRMKAIETYIKIDSLLGNKRQELPFSSLGMFPQENDFEKYLGTYKSLDESSSFTQRLFIEDNQLYTESETYGKTKHFRVSQESNATFFVTDESLRYFVWEIIETEEGNVQINILSRSNPGPDLELMKRND